MSVVFVCLMLLCYNLFMGKYKGYTEARERANEKYRKEKIDTILVRIPKGKKAVIQDAANEQGVSVNQFINDAIDAAIGTDTDV